MGAREQGAPRGHAGVGSVKAGLKRKPTLGAQGPVVGKPRSELEAVRWSSPTALPDGSAPTHPARAPRFHARFAMSPASERAVPAKAPAAPANSMKSRRLAARTGARVLSIDKDVDIGRALAEGGGAVMGGARPQQARLSGWRSRFSGRTRVSTEPTPAIAARRFRAASGLQGAPALGA